MKHFRLEILSPDRTFYDGECESLTIPIGDGQMGILAGHLPMIAAILPGEITYTVPGEGKKIAAVTSGLVKVDSESVRILVDTALRPEEINEEMEKRDAEMARAALSRKQSIKDYRLSQLTFARAVNNLRVCKHSSTNDK